jgi:hypothetical protein
MKNPILIVSLLMLSFFCKGQSNPRLLGNFKIDLTKTIQNQDTTFGPNLDRLDVTIRNKVIERIFRRAFMYLHNPKINLF